MSRHGADAALITDPSDVAYLTGFLGGDSVLIVPARGKPTLVSDARYEEDVASFSHLARITMRKGPMSQALGGHVSDVGMKRVLVQPEHMTLQMQSAIAAVAGRRTLAPEAGLVSSQAVCKDDSEIRAIRRAIRVQEAALLATLPEIRAGMSELEICARLEFEMKSRGASGPAFGTIVAARANGSRPHYSPGAVKTARNAPLLIDWGAVVAGYRGDMTRVFTLGRWPAQIREVYEIVLEAHSLAAAAIRPGATNHDLDRIARDCITRHGYGPRFGHGLGHGLGIRTHELPSVSQQAAEIELRPGMVITIEPGIYLPGVGGVRIEDDYAVTERGGTNLCSLPKDLAFATLG